VRPGDFVEFVTQDRRVHAVEFTLAGLPPAAASFLRTSGQESSPPLVEADARFVVSFAQAPPGTYPYVVIGNGEEGRGTIVVAEDEE
jgi:plastocyanin